MGAPEIVAIIVGALGIFGVLARMAAKVTRIHDAATIHLPKRIDDEALERKVGFAALRADHEGVNEKLAGLSAQLGGVADRASKSREDIRRDVSTLSRELAAHMADRHTHG